MKLLALSIIGSFLLLTSCIETRSSRGQDATSAPKETPVEVTDDENQVISLFGSILPQKQLIKTLYEERMRELQKARTAYEKDPRNTENIIWYGRRLAYLGRYQEAIHIYSVGLDIEPNNYKLLRHRGHRYITTREFDNAIEDLQRAAFYARPAKNETEPDGIPNRFNTPRSNTKFNIWYHLGIAYYLKGNYDKAISAFKKCMEFATNDDLLVATTDWFYLTYQKIGNKSAAKELLGKIEQDMRIMENYSYHQHLLMFKGSISPESLLTKAKRENNSLYPTLGYGIAQWFFYNGQVDQGKEVLDRILLNEQWDTFGYIAAEVDKLALSSIN